MREVIRSHFLLIKDDLFCLLETKKISIKQQTLCITHHPMLAASSDVHYKVEKHLLNGSTSTSLTKLTSIKQKQNELAELIGGGFEDASSYALTLLNKAAA